jgi:hypothetical protein
MGMDEPVVDFTSEKDWRSAQKCFDAAVIIPEGKGYMWALRPYEAPSNR